MGIVAALLSALCSAAKDIYSKKLAALVDGTTSTFASFLFALPYYLALMVVLWILGLENFQLAEGFFFWIVLRALSDAFAEWFKMHAFHHGDLSVVSSLLSLSPIILLITSPLITGDQLTLVGALSVIVTIIGTMIILYKPTRSQKGVSMKAVLFSLGAAVCFSLNSCFDRLAVQTASPVVSGCVMTLVAGIFILPMMARRRTRFADLSSHQALFWQRGLFEILFMVIKLYALTILQAPYVVGIQRISVLFSVVSGKVFFQEEHFVRRLIGSLLVVGGVVSIILQQLL
jgi:uncharacterized membrane protein